MKLVLNITLLFTALLVSDKSFSKDELSPLEGPYMGQNPPNIVAVPFAPGVISKEGWDGEGVFSPEMKEFYYATDVGKNNRKIIGYRQEDNVWTKYIELTRTGEIGFSSDGQRMYMAKSYKERVGDGWSESKSLGPMFDSKDLGIMRLSASNKSTYVFDDYLSGAIRISPIKDGQRQAPKKMAEEINTGKWTAHPFIAPDESYLIWDSEREEGYGETDLYISFRQKDDSWGPAINMGDAVNTENDESFASVTPNGKYILFNRKIDDKNTDVYWVDAKIIDRLRPKK
ncbi:PD40 domain-containing protein [Colwellia piezophila]|uniref:PD40 domain-containing protein n=1 Tax=Colwellia piezophila TaxID=211668 RepID=UPI000378D16B|nr:PD40 domain-containing protein [Colwellia piezophila]